MATKDLALILMTANRCILSGVLILLMITGCAKSITVAIINRTGSDVLIHTHESVLKCEPGRMCSFIPSGSTYDIMIRAHGRRVGYNLQPLPYSFLDYRNEKRILLVLQEDLSLSVLEPTDQPLQRAIGTQPEGYPLLPVLQAIETTESE